MAMRQTSRAVHATITAMVVTPNAVAPIMSGISVATPSTAFRLVVVLDRVSRAAIVRFGVRLWSDAQGGFIRHQREHVWFAVLRTEPMEPFLGRMAQRLNAGGPAI